MRRVVHFEIHSADPERAVRFYHGLFGWEFSKWDGPVDYWVIRTGPADQPGINGGLLRRHGTIDGTAVIAYVCTIDVPGLDDALTQALGLGATVALPKMPIPGVGWLAYVKDTEGNIFGMMQADAQAR